MRIKESPITCPYCNSVLPGPVAEGSRLVCPRCGEPIPARSGPNTSPDSSTAIASGPPPGAPDVPRPDRKWSNRAVGALVLAVMGGMFAFGLVFALWTQSFREKVHQRPPGDPVVTPPTPAELPALGYLPPPTNVVAALRPADLVDHPLGRKLMEAPRPVLFDAALTLIETRTGVKAANIDHLVAGITVTKQIPFQIPPLILVVQTRVPYLPGAVTQALKNHNPQKHLERPLFRFALEPVGEGWLWCPTERRLVLILRPDAVTAADLDLIPKNPWNGAEHLARPLRAALEKLPHDSLAWVAGHLPDPGPQGRLLALLAPKSEPAKLLPQVQTFALGLVPEKKLRLAGAFQGRDAKTTRYLEKVLERLKLPGGETKVQGPPSLAPLAAHCLAFPVLAPNPAAAGGVMAGISAVPTGPEALWVNWQARAGVDQVREFLQAGSAWLPFLRR